MFSYKLSKLTFIAVLCFIPSPGWCNHGPGTSGGGTSTTAGETLKENQLTFSMTESYTSYDDVSREVAEERALKSGGYDSLRDAYLTSFSVSYGLTDDLQIDGIIGWYSGRGFISAHPAGESEHEALVSLKNGDEDHGVAESATGNPEGLTDLLIQAKYKVLQGRPGNLAIIGGVIFPTGDNDERLSNGEKLEPSSQPGTGAFGYRAGLGYSRFLTSHLTVDASSIYTLRTEHDGFEVGDRFDNGVALSYRLFNSNDSFPRANIFCEVSHVWLGKDTEPGEGKNPNSGGNSLFLTSGLRMSFSDSTTFTLAPSVPVMQNLYGDQVEVDFRILGQLTWGFF